eukprot:9336449-Karenia_brevis.AAC.1
MAQLKLPLILGEATYRTVELLSSCLTMQKPSSVARLKNEASKDIVMMVFKNHLSDFPEGGGK